MHDHSSTMMDHSHHIEPESTPKEYAKFIGVILGIIIISYFAASNWGGLSVSNFLRIFMGVFFLVFGLFKLLDLKGFTESYIGYDIIAQKSIIYAYIYPFIELALAFGYFLRIPNTEWAALIVMAIGSIGVFKELMRGSKIKCACLGTYIKLPLTTVSLIEDVAMGIMALLMILKVF
jgi:hypothetical protein